MTNEWIEIPRLNDHLQANKALQTALGRLILAVEEDKDKGRITAMSWWRYIEAGEMYQGPDCVSECPMGCEECIAEEIFELEEFDPTNLRGGCHE